MNNKKINIKQDNTNKNNVSPMDKNAKVKA